MRYLIILGIALFVFGGCRAEVEAGDDARLAPSPEAVAVSE